MKVRRPGRIQPLFPEERVNRRDSAPELDVEPTRAFVLADLDRPAALARRPGVRPPRAQRTLVATLSSDLKIVHEPEGQAAMQYRVLRFQIENAQGGRVIAVTSPRVGDGASVTAFNMALALAEGGRQKVVLCDLDLREGGATGLAGLTQARGVTELLVQRRESGMGAIPLYPVSRGLSLLPCGAPAPGGPTLLACPELSDLVAELSSTFDYVVLDVPAVLDHADATLVHDLVDRYLLCVRARSRGEHVRAAIARLPVRKVLGTVLVGAE